MRVKLIDANVILRFLVENPSTIPEKFKGVFTFFPKVEKGEISVFLADLVLFEVFFVLTKYYEIAESEAAKNLLNLIGFKGILMQDKAVVASCLSLLTRKKIDLVDAYLIVMSQKKEIHEIYSFDHDLRKNGLHLAAID